jgi:hypothetical protein
MAHTLRSKSKYGRTRRQRKKQRRMRGGFSITESLSGLIDNFKPETQEKACENAQKKATEICNAYAQSNQSAPPPTQPLIEQQSDQSPPPPTQPSNVVPASAYNEYSSDPDDMDDDPDTNYAQAEVSAEVPAGSAEVPAGSAEVPAGSAEVPEGSPTGLDETVGMKRPRYNGGGSAKKSKKKNKKRSKSRNKKLKSRKHKK